jgi:hypothetical protein
MHVCVYIIDGKAVLFALGIDSMRVSMCVCMYVHLCMYACVCIYNRWQGLAICSRPRFYTSEHVSVCMYMYACMHACVYLILL